MVNMIHKRTRLQKCIIYGKALLRQFFRIFLLKGLFYKCEFYWRNTHAGLSKARPWPHLNNGKIPIDFNRNGPIHPLLLCATFISEYQGSAIRF